MKCCKHIVSGVLVTSIAIGADQKHNPVDTIRELLLSAGKPAKAAIDKMTPRATIDEEETFIRAKAKQSAAIAVATEKLKATVSHARAKASAAIAAAAERESVVDREARLTAVMDAVGEEADIGQKNGVGDGKNKIDSTLQIPNGFFRFQGLFQIPNPLY